MSIMAWKLSHLVLPPCRVTQHCSGMTARVVEPPYTVAIYRKRAAGLHCTVTVLQSTCSHVLLAFNVSTAARFAGV
jgi:hypothetical protein